MDYIIKPVRQENLLKSTHVALKHKDLADEKESCRKNFEAIFRSVKEGIVTVDRNMAVIEINKAAAQICSVQRDAVISKPVKSLTEQCQGGCIETLQEIFEFRNSVETRYVECHLNHNPFQVVSLTASPLLNADQEFTGAVMVISDESRLIELERTLKKGREASPMVGNSEGIRKTLSLIKDLADVQTTVLVIGESGTGKELVVEELHLKGDRSKKSLVKVNCAALSENLLESELFGHVVGAFTGAIKNKIGRFQRADGGTLFLDEIGEISPRMQLRLLRVIETGEFERVGDSTPITVDVRIVAVTNRNLKERVTKGKFRPDLYYRLKVVEITLQPLRERMDDLPLLLEHFLAKFNQKFDKKIKYISTDVWKIFENYEWPGNIRELENTLEHAFIRCHESAITENHLPADFRKLHKDSFFTAQTREEGAEVLLQALRHSHWNKSKAARLLGISRRSIYRKMDKFGITLEP